jgi:hypothetical protein
MRINGSDARPRNAVPSAERGGPNEPECEFADSASHDVELRMEVVRVCDVRRQRSASRPVSLDRLFEIRRRISRGAYDSVEVLDSVARKILDRHDV